MSLMKSLVADNDPGNLRGYSGYVSISGPITSLQGLQNCSSLTSLYLESNEITDLSPVSQLSALIGLHLDYNNTLSDLSPLSGLTGLQNLEVRSGNEITGDSLGSISTLLPLAPLVNLQEVEISGQPVTSLAPLANMFNLQYLYMYGVTGDPTFTGGITVVSNFKYLLLLEAAGRGITDISPAASLSSLQIVDFSYNSITDFTTVGTWTAAQSVILEYNNNNSPIPALPALGTSSAPVTLDLSNNVIADASNIISTPVPGLQATGSVLNIHNNHIPTAQATAIQSTYPNLSVNYP